jgi:hypothetical protein
MLETWTLHTLYVVTSPQTNLIIIESHHRDMVNHHHSWYVMRQLLQLNAT